MDRYTEIDWYPDGFEVVLAGRSPVAMVYTLATPLAVSVSGCLTFLWVLVAASAATTLVEGIGVAVLLVGVVAASAWWLPTLGHHEWKVQVSSHHLRISRGKRLQLDVPLESVTAVDSDGLEIVVRTEDQSFRFDGRGADQDAVERVAAALSAAVEVRRVPESDDEKERRERAMKALERMRQGARGQQA